MRKLIGFILLTSISLASNADGGWPKPKGKGYYKLSQWWLVSDRHFTSSGNIDPNSTRGTFTTSFYAEHGLTNRLTGIVYLPFLTRTYENTQISGTTGQVTEKGEALNSFGDTDIGIKYGLSKPGGKFVASATLMLGLPTGNARGGSDGSFQTGDGEFNQLIQFDLSKSFSIGSIPAFGTIYSGFNNRTNNYSDEVRFGGELGGAFANEKIWFITKLNIVESLKNGATAAEGGGSIFANNTEFASYTFEAAYYFNKTFGLSASYSSAFSGEIIFADPAYSVGLFLDIK